MPTNELFATLSAHAYGGFIPPALPPTVSVIGTWNNSRTGFTATAYLDAETNTAILAFAGTHGGDAGDLASDKAIALGVMPPQGYDAWAAFEALSGVLPAETSIAVTGHSLGGALTQLVVNEAFNRGRSVTGVTFAAPGMAMIATSNGETIDPSIGPYLVNYVTPSDPIANFRQHIGAKVSIPALPSQLIPFSTLHPGGVFGWILRQHPIRVYLDYFKRLFKTASPVIVDLDGDGVETRATASGVFFDHENDGFAQQTGWVGADDALLVRDLNGNGQIDSGRELFGAHTLLPSGTQAADGFQPLAALDGNGDGRLDSADSAWSQLQLWKDENGDGVVGPGELRTLASAGITAVGTAGMPSAFVDEHGNRHGLVGSVTRADGTTRASADVWFQQDLVESVATQSLPVPPDVAALPGVQGHGTVRDLHQAIVRDGTGELRASLEAFVAATSPAQRQAALELLLFRWTGAQDIDPSSRGSMMDARQLHVLEQFLGEPYVGVTGPNPHHTTAPVLIRGYERVFEMVYGRLMAQTELASLYELVTYEWDESIGEVRGDFSAVEAELVARIGVDPASGNASLGEFARTLHGIGLEGGRAFWRFRHEMGEIGAQYATTIDSWLKTVVAGSAASETVAGTAGDDLVDGGAGNDTLAGGGGADTYALRRGTGQDTIDDLSPSDNRIVVAPDVLPADVVPQRSGDRLALKIAGTADQLTVLYWFGAEVYVNGGYQWVKYQIEEVGFGADGTVWNLDTIKRKVLEASAGDDTLTGYEESADTILGLAGNDQIAGRDGNDTLDGGSGADGLDGDTGDDTLLGGADADTLLGGAGNDTLDGGTGNDNLDGQADNDTYVFGRGAGQDTAWDLAAVGSGGADRVLIAADVTPAQLTVQRSGTNLVLGVAGTTDQLLARGWFGESFYAGGWYVNQYQVERVEFLVDGTIWDIAALKQRAIQGTAGNDTLTGYDESDDTILGLAGNDQIAGRAGDDTLDGGSGADGLNGESGDDTLLGGADADTLLGAAGNDTLDGGAGNDSLDGQADNDTYVFGRGAGQDTVWDLAPAGAGGTDRVLVAAGVTPMEVTVQRSGTDLVLGIAGTADQLLIRGWFGESFYAGGWYSNQYQVERVEFLAGGTVWDVPALLQMSQIRTIQGTSGPDTLTGSAAADVLRGLAGDDVLQGGDGDDLLDGGAGADSMSGQGGNDSYVVDSAGDVVTEAANQGTDAVQSEISYTLPAHVESLTLTGTAAVNGTGNALDNRLTGNAAANTLAGGAGDDVYVVGNAEDVVAEGSNQGTDTVESSVSYTLPSNVEILRLTGTSAISGTGNGLGNALSGNTAANALDGAGGADTMAGGAGDDSYVVDQAGDVIVERAGEGIDSVRSSTTYTLPANVENLTLTGNSSTNATGNASDNVLTGNGKPNTLTGGAGNDTYVVQNTNDGVLENAGAGTDTVLSSVAYTLPANVENLTLTGTAPISGTGNGLGNTLAGNRAANVLTGGAGNDIYVLEPGSGQDVIVDTDATAGNSDMARFGATIDPLDLVIKRVGNDLVMSVHGSADGVSVRDWYLDADRQVETIQAGDGSRLVSSQVPLLIQDMAAFSTSTGLTWDQAIDQRPGDVQVILAGRWQP